MKAKNIIVIASEAKQSPNLVCLPNTRRLLRFARNDESCTLLNSAVNAFEIEPATFIYFHRRYMRLRKPYGRFLTVRRLTLR